MLQLLRHQGPLGSICLQQDSDHECLWAGYHSVMDVTVYSVDLVSIIFWSAFTHDTSGFMVWGPSVIYRSHICCLYVSDGHTHVWHRPGEHHLLECHLHHDTAKHGYSSVVKELTGEWNGALLSSVMRVGCLYASDGRTCVQCGPGECHLPECIFP